MYFGIPYNSLNPSFSLLIFYGFAKLTLSSLLCSVPISLFSFTNMSQTKQKGVEPNSHALPASSSLVTSSPSSSSSALSSSSSSSSTDASARQQTDKEKEETEKEKDKHREKKGKGKERESILDISTMDLNNVFRLVSEAKLSELRALLTKHPEVVHLCNQVTYFANSCL